ncbi:DNA-binding CsgD family transcriptional regulator/DNA-binding MarR family transcriptional regulator [Kibdelosporangium banguiense]|uniref:DNA-binding CsgD family transcriptional regulator/DNA-binding MarR family transcriptional regulator n=1 Tax=Kibdelosporangium banguiense TaxID=1365924 RepID=A0ABS4U3F5_9PSEU|nr:helix-turn-helix domain-containing protein [Kibdelosporangium banguiense]MBP2331192.1 DNA-binding CsgD family transcriptional regulator/DNA-binding MarR family transcriptional regulator [Kibdelosporangium banguiense]
MLEVAGLNAAEVSAYRTLLRFQAASVPDLAEQLGISQPEAADLLRELENRGMASTEPGGSPRYRATAPDLAFGPLLQSREQELREIRARITQLTDEYRSRTAALRGASHFVELVHGAKAIAQRVDQLQRNARKEVRGLVKPPVVAVSARDNKAEFDVLAEGVRYRVIYDRQLLMLPGDPYQVSEAAERGEEARIAVDLPLKLAIADDDLALVPVAETQPGGEPSAVLLQPSGLLDALVALFETLWVSSTPILVGTNGELDEDRAGEEPTAGDMRLLSLLLAGLTDQSIAAQLGLSTRTVQRRLHDLIKITGVRTRVQLIWQATKRGWI